MTFQLDTSGYVQCHAPDQKPKETTGCWFWSDLSPFMQGYIEAFKEWNDLAVGDKMPVDWGFKDIAPDALAAIISDCERYQSVGLGDDNYTHGYRFGLTRFREQIGGGFHPDFPPLTVQLGDDGKVRFV